MTTKRTPMGDEQFESVVSAAMLFDELMAKRPGIEAKAPPAPRAMQPGAGQGGQGGSRTIQKARAMQRLAQTGSVEDAAAALLS